jgi:hypothetical protein
MGPGMTLVALKMPENALGEDDIQRRGKIDITASNYHAVFVLFISTATNDILHVLRRPTSISPTMYQREHGCNLVP